jgi:hypothetical protein
MMNKINWLAMLLIAFVFGMIGVGTVNAQTTVHGAWDNGQEVIYFSEGGIFVLYRNGNFVIDGSYSLNADARNKPQSIVFNFGVYDLMDSEFNIEISANALIFTNKRPNQFGTSIAVPGTYRRSSFVLAESGNPLIGTWKSGAEIYRFYRNGEGTLFSYQNEPIFSEMWRFRISYEFSAALGTGSISLKAFDENWSYGVVAVFPFVINGNILRVDYGNGIAEFTRQ